MVTICKLKQTLQRSEKQSFQNSFHVHLCSFLEWQGSRIKKAAYLGTHLLEPTRRTFCTTTVYPAKNTTEYLLLWIVHTK